MTKSRSIYKLFPVAVFALTSLANAQTPLPSTIIIEVENYVEYLEDTSDPFKRGTDPNITVVRNPPPNTFLESDHLADIVSVNGQPAKGLAFSSSRVIGSNTASIPGRPIGDIATSTFRAIYFQILGADGAYIGTIYCNGPHSQPPPGSPTGAVVGDYAIVGGTGVFAGVRGQAGLVNVVAGRLASASEDPSRRRIHGGSKKRFVLSVYPMAYPQVAAVTHSSDFKQVTAAVPALAGEILSSFVTGLGPTRPGVDPGLAFPQSLLAVVSSPVQVTVGGKAAEVLSAVGYPGAVDGYQVNFRVPEGLAKGSLHVRVSSAWISGSPVSIVVQ